MKASVVIPTKNPGPRFRQVLTAVLDQEAPFDYEVLIVDSGSTDATLEYLGAVRDARLRVLSIPPESFGHGRTRNLGAAKTAGQYCLFLTHDAVPADRHWLANLVAPADADPDIAGVFGRHLACPDASPFTRRELEEHFAGFAAHPVVSRDHDRGRYESDVGWRQFCHFFSDNNALIRRTAWEEIPYPDVDFAEDQIWAHRVIEAGWKKAYAHDAAVYHSHDYPPFERLRRSFDESFAFHRLFGYRLCPGLGHMLLTTLALTRRDLKHAAVAGLWRSHPGAVAKAPLDNLMRVLGHYLGAHGEQMPDWLKLKLSRDRRMLAGLVSTSRPLASSS